MVRMAAILTTQSTPSICFDNPSAAQPIELAQQTRRLQTLLSANGARVNPTRLFGLLRGRGLIWHSTGYQLPPRWLGRIVVSASDALPQLYQAPPGRDHVNRVFAAADTLICPSAAVQRDIANLYPQHAAKTTVVSPAPTYPYQQPLLKATEKPLLLCHGGAHAYLNTTRILQAYARWRRRHDFTLGLVWRGRWFDANFALLDEIGARDPVRIFDVSDLPRLYREATAYIYPALYDGAALALLDALSFGLPTAASWLPATVERAGDCPIYFEPTDIDSMVAALDALVMEHRDGERASRGLAWMERYSWERTLRGMLEIYQRSPAP
jgi:glycosyltransferase involved in cell wall biosynthesis